MNDSTALGFWEGGAKDGIQKYNQDLHVSASHELTNDSERQGNGEQATASARALHFLKGRHTVAAGPAPEGSVSQEQKALPGVVPCHPLTFVIVRCRSLIRD